MATRSGPRAFARAVSKRFNAEVLRRALAALPLLVLAIAFAGVCVQAGTPWPWNRVVHEDGRRTLLQTIFYFEHATRELLLDAVLAIGIAGAMRYFYPLRREAADDGALRQVRRRMAAFAVTMLVVIIGGTAWTDGGRAILDNLAQYHTRESAPLVWGAHWRYHFLERIADLALAFALAGTLWIAGGRPARDDEAPDVVLVAAAIALFAIATIVFAPTIEPFRDPTFVGHQLRELFTHALVTVPLALSTCLLLARRFAYLAPAASSTRSAMPVYAAAALAAACGAFLLVASLRLGSRAYGQKASLAELLFPHFFEHSLGYLLVAAIAGFLYLPRPR
jgi:hypothetical protein